MKQHTVIIVVLVILLISINFLLYFAQAACKTLEKENFKLKEEKNNIVEMAKMIETLNEDNLSQLYKPIIAKNEAKEVMSTTLASGAKLFVRFNLSSCPPCVNSLKALIKSIAKEIGEENIIILPVYKSKKDLKFFKNEFKSFNIFTVSEDKLYALGTEGNSNPYFFIHTKENLHPLLFFFFRVEFSDLNNRYFKSIVSFFNYQKQLI